MSFWQSICNLFPSSRRRNHNNPLAHTYILGPDMKLISLEDDMKNNIFSETIDIDGDQVTLTTTQDLIDQIKDTNES